MLIRLSEIMMNKKTEIIRPGILNREIVITDGLPGNGKSLFGASILPSLERVEIYSYSEVLESICALNFLEKLDDHSSSEMIKLFLDRKLYEHMMSRKVNFRPSDLTSIFNYPDSEKYIKRLFEAGDSKIPDLVEVQRPILNIQTHNILPFSKPIWSAFGEKLTMLEIVRHPAFMFNQIFTSAVGDLVGNIRNWTVQINTKYGPMPFNYLGMEDVFFNSNQFERTVLFINSMMQKAEEFKLENKSTLSKLFTIPFEEFTLSPDKYIDEICKLLGTKKTKYLDDQCSKANIPRTKVTDMPDMEVYKQCGGWSENITQYSDREEIDMRVDIVRKNTSKEIFDIFIDDCKFYEDKYWTPSA